MSNSLQNKHQNEEKGLRGLLDKSQFTTDALPKVSFLLCSIPRFATL